MINIKLFSKTKWYITSLSVNVFIRESESKILFSEVLLFYSEVTSVKDTSHDWL